MAGDDIAEVLLVSERQEKRSSPDQQQPGVEPGKASGVGENCSRVGPSRAASQASSPRRTSAERHSESPGDVDYQVITGAMVGVVRQQAQAEQRRTAAALEEARGELDRLRAAEAEHARQADALRAELADAVAARERAEHDSRQVRARAETAESHATTARQEASEARLALAAAQGEAATAARLQERAEDELRQARADRDLQRERAVAAEQQARTAQAERERTAEQMRDLRERLAAAQVAAGLVLPDLADLSGDLGDGVRGVALPEAGICVARQPDGAVVLHQQDRQIRLGEDEHAPAYGRALAAGLLAVVTSPTTRQEGDDHA